MSFQGKRILFISPSFFNYEEAIKNRLLEQGAVVDYFDERPSNSIWTKGIIRVNPKLYKKQIEKYYQAIQEKIKDTKYDYFLLIKGESIPFTFLDFFKTCHPNTQRIFYMYDTVEEYPRFKELIPHFNKSITFERSDAKAYSLLFRPLFYLKDYQKTQDSTSPIYDVVFIGTAHSDRYSIGEKLNEICSNMGLKTYLYYYSPSKLAYYFLRLFDKNLKKFDIKKLSFKKLSHIEISEVYQNSFSVLDINKPFQFGLSMRTFEALASGKKILTTNQEIKHYPIYDPQNIWIMDRDKIELHPDFFKTEFKQLDSKALYKMSMDSWLEDVILKEKIDYWDTVLEAKDAVVY